ncbi:RNA polymerase sigma factor [Roseococcus suduntuyensis]|uniref:RNA polymerase sigma-70 factor (ECF subfamily) n=1 Tax=Roseococcus suduntuyensis TaxID=455361 RepID=A0A840AG72_9PROT|nr:DUF6596 domain-containing protein [Roseococcus suduntuyensis]MBB3899523.1 RNA polymerase sigma-70 factor (ECF subfamily) [Roseococcus suduntuyensis]
MSAAQAAEQAAEQAARGAYGRLVALLAARTGDVAAAEDALSDAFQSALRHWPGTGVPDRPEAWLLTVARRRLGHARRHRGVADGARVALEWLATPDSPVELPDRRLQLMLVCAHSAIAAEARAPLMLQTVLGLDAARIASCYLASPAAMAQRLVRAKARIRTAGIPFELPGPEALPTRLSSVLEGIYGAYGTGWADVSGADAAVRGLAEEAIWLARVVVALSPEPEARGLLAMMLHAEARRPARRSGDGAYVPLSQQDTALWSRPLMAEAEALLREAARAGTLGRFQLEAAIQSFHISARLTGQRADGALLALYDALADIAPTAGVLVARAAALAEAGHPAAARTALDALGPELAQHQPWWATRARVMALLGDASGAREAARRAAALTEDPAVRAFLLAGLFQPA